MSTAVLEWASSWVGLLGAFAIRLSGGVEATASLQGDAREALHDFRRARRVCVTLIIP